MQGSDSVSVEVQSGKGRAFGNGSKVHMTVAEVMERLHSGSEQLYLSTQEAPVEADGFPALLTPPLHRLVDHGLPLKPAVMGNLVPQVKPAHLNAGSGHAVSPACHHPTAPGDARVTCAGDKRVDGGQRGRCVVGAAPRLP